MSPSAGIGEKKKSPDANESVYIPTFTSLKLYLPNSSVVSISMTLPLSSSNDTSIIARKGSSLLNIPSTLRSSHAMPEIDPGSSISPRSISSKMSPENNSTPTAAMSSI